MNNSAKSEIRKSSWVNWIGNFESASGYSEGIRAMLKGLSKNNFYLKTQNRNFGLKVKMKDDIYSVYIKYKKAELEDRYVTLQTMPPVEFYLDNDAYLNIGRTADESSGISDEWVSICNKMDEIWVPSLFNRDTFVESGVSPEKVFVIPDAIDLDLYDFNTKPLYIEGKKEFNFLSIFDWKLKKGWDILIESFAREFSARDNVSLIIRTFSFSGIPFETIKEKINEIIIKKSGKSLIDAPKIILIEKMLTQEEMAALYKSCDCFVLPTRGEGWGRPFMEAMVMGLLTIGTGWGGQLDFMNEGNSCLIDYKLDFVSAEGYFEIPTFKNKKWANPSVKHLMKLIRNAYENRSQAKEKGQIARAHILDSYNCKAIGKLVSDRLLALKDWDKKPFSLFLSKEDMKMFNKISEKDCLTDKYRDNGFFNLRTFSGSSVSENKIPDAQKRFNFNIHLNKYNEKKDFCDFHDIMLMDRNWLIDDEKSNLKKILSIIKNRIDDLWVYGSKHDFNNRYLEENDIFYADFNDFSRENLKRIKERLILLKRKPVKKILDSRYLKKIKEYPVLIKGLRKIKYLVNSDMDCDKDFIDFFLAFIKKNSNDADISLVICINPGKAKKFIDFIERLFKLNNLIITEDSPDIVVFDEVVTEIEAARLIACTDYFISSKSNLDKNFENYAIRLNKEILDFNNFK